MTDNLLGDAIRGSSFSHELGVTSMIQTGEEEGSFVNSLADSQQTRTVVEHSQSAAVRDYSYSSTECIQSVDYLPMILQDTSNITLPKSLCNIDTFFLGQRNASVVIVDT